MKKIVLTLLVLMSVLCGVAAAGTVTLAWDEVSRPAALPDTVQIRYQLFHKLEKESVFDFTAPIYDGPDTTFEDRQEAVGDHRYACRAYYVWTDGTMIASALSNTVSYVIEPPPPPLDAPTLIIQAIDQIIQGLQTLKQAVEAK